MIPKTEWRQILLQKRRSLSSQRRKEAAQRLKDLLAERGTLLSFSSFRAEIDSGPLNALLAAQGRLFLPRVEGSSLVPYRVQNLEQDLALSSSGLLEPNPHLCKKAPLEILDAVLVPALGFDPDRFRLGYGKGYYDRFLAQTKLHSIGIGFLEQRIETALPRDPWDIPVQELLLA